MYKQALAAALLLSTSTSCGSEPPQQANIAADTENLQTPARAEEVPLWPADLAIKPSEAKGPESGLVSTKGIAGKPVRFIQNISRPTMTIYPPRGRNTGAALMVFPGGGYTMLAIDLEGTEICDWATAKGMTCVVLKYRAPQTWRYYDDQGHWLYERQPQPFLPLQDAQRAVGLLRQRAASLGVDPHKIGVTGFSAGGHLVTAIANATGRSYPKVDAADDLSARPDFAMPLYPGHLWDSVSAKTKKNGIDLYDFDPIREDGPPTFIVQAEDDPIDDVRNSIAYFLALKAKKVPVEMHIYAHGGHAFGVRPTGEPITKWPTLAETWLHTIGML